MSGSTDWDNAFTASQLKGRVGDAPSFAGAPSFMRRKYSKDLAGINLVGMGVMEVAPAYDVGEVTAYAAATLAAEMLCLFAANPHREKES